MSKQCEYHKEFGHTTQESQKLEDGIEWLIQHGYLKQYILESVEKKGAEGNRRAKQTVKSNH